MVLTGNIHFLKQSSNGQKFEFSGTFEEFFLDHPDNLRIIEVKDICVIKISGGVTPNQVVSKLKFAGTDSSDFNDDALDEYDIFDWGEYQFLPGVIQRQAVITDIENNNQFQIVGIIFEEDIKLFARTPPYLSTSLRDSYGEENILLYNQWYSEGPGPVSWEGEFAVFLIQDHLLFTSQGDAEEDTYIVKLSLNINLSEIIYNWLIDHGNLVTYILGNVSPVWNNANLLEKFRSIIEALSSNTTLMLFISEAQKAELLEVIRMSSNSDSRVLDILEVENHPRANSLVEYLIQLSNQGFGSNLISWGDFLDNISE